MFVDFVLKIFLGSKQNYCELNFNAQIKKFTRRIFVYDFTFQFDFRDTRKAIGINEFSVLSDNKANVNEVNLGVPQYEASS